MNQLSNSKVSNSIYVINTQIAKISGNVCSVLTPFNNSLMFPRTPFKGSFKGPSRARLKEWSNGHYLPALYSSAGAHEMVFWNVLNLMIWMRAIGVEMKMLMLLMGWFAVSWMIHW